VKAVRGIVCALALLAAGTASAQVRPIPLPNLRSGIEYAGADVQAMQADDTANPGMLWVERGDALFEAAPDRGAVACAGCHSRQSLRGAATRYPQWDSRSSRVIDLEDRINACRVRHQNAAPLPRGTDDLLALTASVANTSHGMTMHVRIDGPARAAFVRGRSFYLTRRGQMNQSCANCHDANYGAHLLTETISQGHGTAFPAYRLEWQAMGSLQRRLRACLSGIRANMPAEGAQELTELELYLAWRADGLPVEAPGVRR
jgi:sulfur-oxidizing protein SoxA